MRGNLGGPGIRSRHLAALDGVELAEHVFDDARDAARNLRRFTGDPFGTRREHRVHVAVSGSDVLDFAKQRSVGSARFAQCHEPRVCDLQRENLLGPRAVQPSRHVDGTLHESAASVVIANLISLRRICGARPYDEGKAPLGIAENLARRKRQRWLRREACREAALPPQHPTDEFDMRLRRANGVLVELACVAYEEPA